MNQQGMTAVAFLAVLIGGCGVVGSDVDAGPTGPTDGGHVVTGCPTQTEIAFATATRGTTGAGWSEDLSGWFAHSDVACVPGTMASSYPAPFTVFSLQQPRTSDWDIVVTPDSGVDVNVVAWQQSATDASCYPTRGIGVVTCEVAGRAAAGAAESVRLQATTNPYQIVILVTTPEGGTPGGFSLAVNAH